MSNIVYGVYCDWTWFGEGHQLNSLFKTKKDARKRVKELTTKIDPNLGEPEWQKKDVWIEELHLE